MAFFKYMVKAIAEKHGLRATFMPKPFANLTGNGCHVHVSLWQGDRNAFADGKDELGLSKTAYNFIGGMMNAAEELCAITNPTVNSYKRINAPGTLSGATWSPNTVTYAGNNRTHMIRIPDAGRFELRLADGAANPYLLPAAILAAGLDGIAQEGRSRQAARLSTCTPRATRRRPTPRSCRSTSRRDPLRPKARSCSGASSATSSSTPTSS